MLTGELAEFSGHIYRDPRVTVVTEDARAYVKRHQNKFDLIYSLSSNTFAAVASGSFALAENYLFTTEAFRDYWTAMSDSGFMYRVVFGQKSKSMIFTPFSAWYRTAATTPGSNDSRIRRSGNASPRR